jgi:hypothetical protein
MLMYLICNAVLSVGLFPLDFAFAPVANFMGLELAANNPGMYTALAPHGGVVSSNAPVAVLFSSFGIANRFLPIQEYLIFILPIQLQISGIAFVLSLVRLLLRFVPGITAG